MDIMGIRDISEITEGKIKGLFRSKIRGVHPDLGGSEKEAKNLIKSYEILMESARKLEESIKTNNDIRDTIIISVEELISIYEGNTLTVSKYGTTETVELSKNNLSDNRVLVLIQGKLSVSGTSITNDDYVIYNSRDVYSIDINVDTIRVEIGDKATLSIGDDMIDVELISKQMLLTVRLKYNITIRVRISLNNT